jgi:6-pyruvoyltetrahydropterin/6-carboxytetrahydropterin synthase
VPGRTVAENRALFGGQVLPHEHAWRVRVEIRGPIDPVTGFAADLVSVDQALERLLGGWDGGDLNQCVPEVAEGRMQPSTESLARWIFERLSVDVRAPAHLGRVYVWECPELGACYPA